MHKIVTAAAAAVAAVALAFAAVAYAGNKPDPGASPSRIAGEYVKGLAAANNATIIGDKVWSVRKHGDHTTVVVRVRYSVTPTLFGVPVGPPQVGVTTIFVKLLKAGYAVVG